MRKLSVLTILVGSLLVAGGTARADPLDANALKEIGRLYRTLIDAENRHDLSAVRQMVWRSPDTLFVAKRPRLQKATGRDSGARTS
jgi:hypothetical protein